MPVTLDHDGLPRVGGGRRFWKELGDAVLSKTYQNLHVLEDDPLRFGADERVHGAVMAFRQVLKIAMKEALDDLQRDVGQVRRHLRSYRLADSAAQSSMSQKRAHEVLDLRPGASLEEVKRKYKQLARLYHPDLNPDADPDHIRELNEAFLRIREHLARSSRS